MNERYTEQDSERVRMIEHSSSGKATEHLNLPPTYEPPMVSPPIQQPTNTNNLLALGLLVVGVIMLLGQVLPEREDMTGGMVLLTISSVFLFFAFWKRIYGLLIPGAILAGLSLGVSFASVTDGVSVLWGLATGFASIFFLGKTLFRVKSGWPLIPAAILFGVGFIVLVSNAPTFLIGGLIWVPLALIAAGLFLGFRKP
jgi:hypothetical protein